MIIDESAGEVVIGANTRICHGAVIQGPVVIGANCLIGNYAFIRPGTIISNGVKIGFATEIKNAVIEAEATIGPQCFIADSVVAKPRNISGTAYVSKPTAHKTDISSTHLCITHEKLNKRKLMITNKVYMLACALKNSLIS